MAKRKIGELLADMILYGDIHEAEFPKEWLSKSVPMPDDDPELYTRYAVAATILKLTNVATGGSCSVNDGLVAPYLGQEVDAESGG